MKISKWILFCFVAAFVFMSISYYRVSKQDVITVTKEVIKKDQKLEKDIDSLKVVIDSLEGKIDSILPLTTNTSVDSSIYNTQTRTAKKLKEVNDVKDTLILKKMQRIDVLKEINKLQKESFNKRLAIVERDYKEKVRKKGLKYFLGGTTLGIILTLLILL